MPTTTLCQKVYTITVPSTAMMGYWALEELALPVVDSSGHANFVTASGSLTSIAGKIARGFDLYDWVGTGAVSTGYRFLNHDFSLRFWFKPWYGGTYVGDGTTFLLNNDADLADYSWEIVYSPFASRLGPEWNVWDSTNTGFRIGPNAVLTNAWHHVYCWVEDGVGIGMRIDNGAWQQTLAFGTNHIYSTAGTKLRLNRGAVGGADPHNYVDEIAIWNRKLSAAEITYDYNAGAGRTWPDVPL